MTALKERRKAVKGLGFFIDALKPIILVILMLILLYNLDTVKRDVYNGIKWIISCLIPTLFPFAILTHLLTGTSLRLPMSRVLSKLLGVRDELLVPLVLGIICGFPIGAMLTREIYINGAIKKEEAERVIILSSQPSLAYLIGIGTMGLSGSKKACSLVMASLITVVLLLLLTRRKYSNSAHSGVISRQSLPLAKYITLSGEAMINLSFFITAFYAIASVIKLTIKRPAFVSLILPFLELSNAINYACSLDPSLSFKAFIIPFSLGFSGLSVYLQIKSILRDTDLTIRKYIPIKLVEGIVMAIFTIILEA